MKITVEYDEKSEQVVILFDGPPVPVRAVLDFDQSQMLFADLGLANHAMRKDLEAKHRAKNPRPSREIKRGPPH